MEMRQVFLQPVVDKPKELIASTRPGHFASKHINLAADRRSRRDALRLFGGGSLAALAAAGGVSLTAPKAKAQELPPVVLEWLDAWATADPPSAVSRLYPYEGSYQDIPWGETIPGSEIESYLRNTLAGLTGFQREMQGWLLDGNYVVLEQYISGANNGLFADAEIGATFESYCITILEIEENVVKLSIDMYDFAYILFQLGVVTDSIWSRGQAATEPEDDCGILCKKSG